MVISIRPDEERAVLRVAAYHRRDFDLIVIRSPPGEHTPVAASLAQPFPTSPASSFGSLEHLPFEIISAICLHLDILSCMRFRQVNRMARKALSGLPEYKAIADYASEALRAVLRTGIATRLTLYDLYHPLCAMECSLCGCFGGFLFLPTAKRCCFNCIGLSSDLYIVSLSALSKASKISTSTLRRVLPFLRTVPGVYSMDEKLYKKRLNIVAEKAAFATLHNLGIWHGPSNNTLKPLNSTAASRCMASTAFPYLNRETTEVENGVSCKGCQAVIEVGGLQRAEAYHQRDRAYSKQGFLTHFQECREAQNLWSASCGGTVPFDEPAFTRRGGYLGEFDSTGCYR